jgi:hypothetical protein
VVVSVEGTPKTECFFSKFGKSRVYDYPVDILRSSWALLDGYGRAAENSMLHFPSSSMKARSYSVCRQLRSPHSICMF